MAGTESQARKGPFNGWHMTAILVAFFSVVIVVNVMMARLATGTFGGVVVENSYVASQHYTRWLDEAAKEKALGWKATASRSGAKVAVDLAGAPTGAVVRAVARHPLGTLPDRELTFAQAQSGRFVSVQDLPAGRWELRLEVSAGGQRWRSEEPLS